MKKVILCFFILFAIVAGGSLLSYSASKSRAEIIAQNFRVPISPLEGHLVLFIDNEFSPCWIFIGEFESAITGATFDVYVSLFGKVLKVPA